MADERILELVRKLANEITGDEYLVSAESGGNNRVQLNDLKTWLEIDQILTDLADKQDVSPNDNTDYVLYNGALRSILRLIDGTNVVSNIFSIQRNGFGIQLVGNGIQMGRFNGINLSYWDAIDVFSNGNTEMKYYSDQDKLPLADDDYTGGITPLVDINRFITYKTVNPPSIEITSATATLDSSYSNSNGEINYNNAVGGDLIIEDDLLEIDQLMSLYISNTGMPTFVAGTGVTIVNKDGLFTGSQRYGTIIISKKDIGEYNISGDLA